MNCANEENWTKLVHVYSKMFFFSATYIAICSCTVIIALLFSTFMQI